MLIFAVSYRQWNNYMVLPAFYALAFVYAGLFMRRPFLCAGLFYAPVFFMRRPLLCAGLFYAPAFIMRRPFLCAGLFYAPAFLCAGLFNACLFYAPAFLCLVYFSSPAFFLSAALFYAWGRVFHLLSVCVGVLDILVLSTILYLPSKQTLGCILLFCCQTRN